MLIVEARCDFYSLSIPLGQLEVVAQRGLVVGETRRQLDLEVQPALHGARHDGQRRLPLRSAAERDVVRGTAVIIAQPAEAHRRAGGPARRLQHLLVRRDGDVLGVSSIDILYFERKTGLSSGPNSALGHYKFRHVSKLQT